MPRPVLASGQPAGDCTIGQPHHFLVVVTVTRLPAIHQMDVSCSPGLNNDRHLHERMGAIVFGCRPDLVPAWRKGNASRRSVVRIQTVGHPLEQHTFLVVNGIARMSRLILEDILAVIVVPSPFALVWVYGRQLPGGIDHEGSVVCSIADGGWGRPYGWKNRNSFWR